MPDPEIIVRTERDKIHIMFEDTNTETYITLSANAAKKLSDGISRLISLGDEGWKVFREDHGIEVRTVSLEEASRIAGDIHFVHINVFRDEMPGVPERCIGTLSDVLYCLTPHDWKEWTRR